MRRCRGPRRRSIPPLKNLMKLIDGVIPVMQLQDGADDGTNHPSQKRIRLNLEIDQIAFLPTPGLVNLADRVDSIAARALERGKIPYPDQFAADRVRTRNVDWRRQKIGAVSQER